MSKCSSITFLTRERGGFGGGVQLEAAAGVMGSVSHERLGAAQATGKRVFTPMMWSPLIRVRRSWFAIGSAPACASKIRTPVLSRRPPRHRRDVILSVSRTGTHARRLVRHVADGAESGELAVLARAASLHRLEPAERSLGAAEPAARDRHALPRADDITHLLEPARDLSAADNRYEREQRERDGREEDRAREAPSPGRRGRHFLVSPALLHVTILCWRFHGAREVGVGLMVARGQ